MLCQSSPASRQISNTFRDAASSSSCLNGHIDGPHRYFEGFDKRSETGPDYFHDRLDLSSQTHGFPPGLSRFGRAETRMCARRHGSILTARSLRSTADGRRWAWTRNKPDAGQRSGSQRVIMTSWQAS